MLQMANFHRNRMPIIMEIGPVLAIEDVAGGDAQRSAVPGKAASGCW